MELVPEISDHEQEEAMLEAGEVSEVVDKSMSQKSSDEED